MNHQQSCVISPNEILKKLVTVKEVVFTQFRSLFETKRCMTCSKKLNLKRLCSSAYQKEPLSSLPSTSSELRYLKIYF